MYQLYFKFLLLTHVAGNPAGNTHMRVYAVYGDRDTSTTSFVVAGIKLQLLSDVLNCICIIA